MMKEEIYNVEGMSCAACSSAVERVTRKIDGVERSDVNLATNRMTIAYDESKVTRGMIEDKVKKAGFGCSLYERENKTDGAAQKTAADEAAAEKAKDEAEDRTARVNLVGAWVFSVLLLYVSMGSMLPVPLPLPPVFGMHTVPTNFALVQLLFTIPILYFGRRFFVNGFKALFHGNPNMDSLVAVGSSCSFIYSLVLTFLIPYDVSFTHGLYYESAAIVITFVMTGKYFESRSKRRTKSAITKLMQLAPETALLWENGTVREVPSASLKPGDTVLVRPGMRVPSDGTVEDGMGGVDESMLTGESLPVEKEPGSPVTGGSINGNGALRIRITRTGRDTTLSKIIALVEDAQSKKAPVSKLADKVAGIFVPVVMIISVVSGIAWAVAGADIAFVLRIVTSVLVIACPCALGLATPAAIMVGTGMGASNGILVRSGEALELAGKTDTIVLDKTGTVTEGKPQVTEIYPAEGITEDELTALAGAAETVSEHPLARAVTEKAGGNSRYTVVSFANTPGQGIRAQLREGNGGACPIVRGGDTELSVQETVPAAEGKAAVRTVLAGNYRLMSENGIDVSAFTEKADSLARQGKSVIYVADETSPLGIIAVSDVVRPTSREAVAMFKKAGLSVILLTGDNKAAAEYIGKQVDADRVIADVLPQDKAAVIVSLQQEGRSVMMVGDGVNDAPALAQADIGTAMGGGSDIAVESGDIVLMKSDLRDAARAVRLSRLTLRNVKENLFWAFLYNTVSIPIAAGVLFPAFGILLTPMIAGFAMSLSSICVVGNALRLRTYKL